MASIVNKLESVPEQRELFLWKFADIDREEVNGLMKEFMAKDTTHLGELDEYHVMMLLEHRGNTMTHHQLRELVQKMDVDNNHMISFIELCCAVYHKDVAELNFFFDEEARQRAVDEAMRASAAKREAEEQIAQAIAQRERTAQIRAAALERESKLTGVAGAAAFFSRKIESASESADATKTNEQRIKEEAARRRVLREAKKALEEAQAETSRLKSAEEIAAEVKAREMRTAEEEAARLKKAEDDERAFRSARKATLNSIWSPKTQKSAAKEEFNRRASLSIPKDGVKNLASRFAAVGDDN